MQAHGELRNFIMHPVRGGLDLLRKLVPEFAELGEEIEVNGVKQTIKRHIATKELLDSLEIASLQLASTIRAEGDSVLLLQPIEDGDEYKE